MEVNFNYKIAFIVLQKSTLIYLKRDKNYLKELLLKTINFPDLKFPFTKMDSQMKYFNIAKIISILDEF